MLLEILGVIEAVLGITRVTFDFLNFIRAAHCVYKGHTVEHCPYKYFPASLNVIGSSMEAMNSFILLIALFFWKRFNVKNYFFALCRVGHFLVWFLLCICYICSNFIVKFVEARDKNGNISMVGVCGVLEMVSLTFLAAAMNFVARETYQFWIEQRVNSTKWRAFFDHLYFFCLFTYLFRNVGLFLYDTALVSLSISITRGTTTTTSDWESLFLVLNAAFRGSFVKFFFAKIFQGRDLPKVCENVADRFQDQDSSIRRQNMDYNIFDPAPSVPFVNSNLNELDLNNGSSIYRCLENNHSQTISRH